jgi:hypothetical protein
MTEALGKTEALRMTEDARDDSSYFPTMTSRRAFLAACAASVVSRRAVFAERAPSVITVYKDAGCDCCVKWIKHLSANGFVVSANDVQNRDEIRRTMNVPQALGSCHTAVVDRYVIEGHVPADVIKKFLAAKPSSLGLAVPGMPIGSPGMEGGRAERYNVLAFERNGTTRVYAKR